MEDLEERRKRLAAMREHAASSSGDGIVSSVPSFRTPPLLANPFLDSGDFAAPEEKGSHFNFYTDPLAGYQGSKRRRPGSGILPVPGAGAQSSNSTSHRGAGLLPHPAHHQQRGYVFSGGSVWQPVANQANYSNPVLPNPQPLPQFYAQGPPQYVNSFSNQPPGRGAYRGISGRFNGRQSPSGPSGVKGLIGRGGSHPQSSGRGRGFESYNDRGGRGNSSAGRSENSGARGGGHAGGKIVSAKEQPHLFVKKSMLEDPWQGLEASGANVT